MRPTAQVSPRAFPGSTTPCPKMGSVGCRHRGSCWASTRRGLSIWRRPTRPSRRRASTTGHTSYRRWSTLKARCCSTSPARTTPANDGSRSRLRTMSLPPWRRSPAGPMATPWPAAGPQRPRRAPTNSVTPALTATPGLSASRRRCRPRSGWAPSKATSRWSTVGAARSTAQGFPPTSGRPPWTAP